MWGALHEASEELTGSLTALYGPPGRLYEGPFRGTISRRLGIDSTYVFPGAAHLNDLPETDEKDVAKFLMSVADDLELA
jgi:hypothetical protein